VIASSGSPSWRKPGSRRPPRSASEGEVRDASSHVSITSISGSIDLVEDYFSLDSPHRVRRTVSEEIYTDNVAERRKASDSIDAFDFESLESVVTPGALMRSSSGSSSSESSVLISGEPEEAYLPSEYIVSVTGYSLTPKVCVRCYCNYHSAELTTEFCSGECRMSYLFEHGNTHQHPGGAGY
jgi:hypothetical protein